MEFRSPFGYDTKAASDETAIGPGGDSLTVQSMSEDADLNVLMRRYGVTGKFPDNRRVPQFGDFSGISDYQSALNAVLDAQEKFMEYPAELRARFSNSPQSFLEFCENPNNLEEMRKLGLALPAKVENNTTVPPKVPEAPAVK